MSASQSLLDQSFRGGLGTKRKGRASDRLVGVGSLVTQGNQSRHRIAVPA
jgi:hypothetical protein